MNDRAKESLRKFVPESWVGKESNQFLIRLYSSLGVPEDLASSVYCHFSKSQVEISGTKILYGVFGINEGSEFEEFWPVWHSGKDGIDHLYLQTTKLKLPIGSYFYLMVPFSGLNRTANETQLLDAIHAILVSICGMRIAYHLVHEGVLDYKKGEIIAFSEGIATPVGLRGPLVWKGNKILLDNILCRLRDLDDDSRGRILASLGFLQEAIVQNNILQYFQAYEILCQCYGKYVELRKKIKLLFKDETAFIDRVWKKVEKWRHNFIHKGERPDVTAETSSFLQLVYLDLLTQELDLPHQKHCVHLIKSGADLSQLGFNAEREHQDGQPSVEQAFKDIRDFWEGFIKANT